MFFNAIICTPSQSSQKLTVAGAGGLTSRSSWSLLSGVLPGHWLCRRVLTGPTAAQFPMDSLDSNEFISQDHPLKGIHFLIQIIHGNPHGNPMVNPPSHLLEFLHPPCAAQICAPFRASGRSLGHQRIPRLPKGEPWMLECLSAAQVAQDSINEQLPLVEKMGDFDYSQYMRTAYRTAINILMPLWTQQAVRTSRLLHEQTWKIVKWLPRQTLYMTK